MAISIAKYLPIRRLNVARGDVFRDGTHVVVLCVSGPSARVVNTHTGRQSNVAVRRLQEVYERLGMRAARQQHRTTAAMLRELERRRERSAKRRRDGRSR